MSSPFHPITPRAGSVTALALKVSVWVLGAALAMGAQAQTTASGADVSVEAPLMGGGLGRAQETQAMGNGAAAGALANGLNGAGLQGLGARMAGQPAQVGAGAQNQNTSPNLGALPALVPTQFEKFVQEATGKNLPLYGYNLFDRSRFPSLTDVPVPANYVVGPGDEIDLKIWGAVDVAMRLPVDRNGQITVPKVGPITVAGTPSSELDAHLKKQVGRVFNNFELSANIGRLRSMQIFVVGQARNPGAYTVSSLSTLISALFESGGPAANGSMRAVQLVRGGKTVTTLDLYKFIHAGDTAADARLLPGDVIVVPAAGPRVALTGATDTPAIFELANAEESIGQLLTYSAGSQTLTTPHKALLERVNKQDAKAPREVQERTLDATGLKTTVRDGDLLTLFKISGQFANAVTLRGNVERPLRHAFKPGMRVADLVPEADALILPDYYSRKNSSVQYEAARNDKLSGEKVANDVKTQLTEINWDYAAIERLDPKAVKTTLIPFNLGKAIKDKDPVHNIALMPGDVVTIFGVDDIPVPLEKRTQFVRLGGEVKAPGIYQVSPGETLPQLVQRAGGLSRDAYLYGTVFNRESTRVQQQDNLNQAIRRMEAQVQSQAATTVQNVYDKDNLANAQAQAAGQRQMLDRLRNLKASGRIALEMDADRPELPALTLQDGDSITVPSKPSFVAVFGAVLAENSFIHRANATVGDYIDKAGPTREADLEAVMLIRGDGTVLSNRAQRSWAGFGHAGFMGTRLQPGDSIFIPEVVDRRTPYTQFIQGAKDWTAILYQFGIGAAALKTLKN
jgi:protein involved in polysaccharide export with SLBB domain